MIVSPYPTIGWSAEHTATPDPRVPVQCHWCLGAKAILQTMQGDPTMREAGVLETLLIICPECEGAGTVRRERRRVGR